ncbi:hypothetical protein L2K70_00355 [Nocardioides KLBMP 9356]|uniref:SseB family protein n=1 Tax=Nocardioides potassii TaxID=2911371 RepID=A0ABS9H465_9ACTN|nr:hypothetical protein [Nocardioides potassii]MCF6376050.1 hypothetical protein [Nocardioides potassii]
MADETGAHARWQQAATSSDTASVLDVVRTVADATSPWPILVRALVVTPVYLRVAEGGRVETSRADEEEYVHVYSSPLRLTAGLAVDVEELTIQEVFVADLVNQAGGRLGIRIDPGLASEQVVPPDMATEVLSVAAGLPVRAALTPGEGEELVVETGPDEVTDLDQRVKRVVVDANPAARIMRAAARLAGIGGRTWPVYSVTGTVQDPMVLSDAVQRAAAVPIVLLIENRPVQLAELVDVPAHGLVLD